MKSYKLLNFAVKTAKIMEAVTKIILIIAFTLTLSEFINLLRHSKTMRIPHRYRISKKATERSLFLMKVL